MSGPFSARRKVSTKAGQHHNSTLTGDSPGIELENKYISEQLTATFEDFFMYKSGRPGSIFVGLAQYQWQANGSSNYSNGQWGPLTNALGPSLQYMQPAAIPLPTAAAVFLPSDSTC